MILKVLDYKKGENQSDLYDVWNYFDNITSASNYYDEGSKMTVVRCTFREGNTVTIGIPHEAYLMSDTGKTVERIFGVGNKPGCADSGKYENLQDAIDYSINA